MYLTLGNPIDEIFTYSVTRKTKQGHIESQFISWFINIHMNSSNTSYFTITISDNVLLKNISKRYNSTFRTHPKEVIDLGWKIFYDDIVFPYIQNNIIKYYPDNGRIKPWEKTHPLLEPPGYQE